MSSLSCASLSSTLPPAMPEDFQLSLSTTGGMLPMSDSFTVAVAGGSYLKRFYMMGNENKGYVEFGVDRAELEDLYGVLYRHKFDAVRTHEEKIYDRGGVEISIAFGGRSIRVADSGMTVIDKDWRQDWAEIYAAASKLKEKLIAQASVEIAFSLSPAIRALDDFSMAVDSENIYVAGESAETRFSRMLVPGDYTLAMYHRGSENYAQRTLTVRGPVTVTVDYADGKFVVK